MKKQFFTKTLSVVAAILIWIPILATLILSVVVTIMTRTFRLDLLMPGELALFAIAGGGVLIWAAIRGHINPKRILITLALMISMLIGAQAIAVISGLASGDRSPTDWVFYLVAAMFAAYTILLVYLAILSIGVCQKVFTVNLSEK